MKRRARKASGAQEAADDRIGNEAYGATGPRETERKQQNAGQCGGKQNDDHHRGKEVISCAVCDEMLGNGRGKRGSEGGCVRRGREENCAERRT
jgi:hypothetical protein